MEQCSQVNQPIKFETFPSVNRHHSLARASATSSIVTTLNSSLLQPSLDHHLLATSDDSIGLAVDCLNPLFPSKPLAKRPRQHRRHAGDYTNSPAGGIPHQPLPPSCSHRPGCGKTRLRDALGSPAFAISVDKEDGPGGREGLDAGQDGELFLDDRDVSGDVCCVGAVFSATVSTTRVLFVTEQR